MKRVIESTVFEYLYGMRRAYGVSTALDRSKLYSWLFEIANSNDAIRKENWSKLENMDRFDRDNFKVGDDIASKYHAKRNQILTKIVLYFLPFSPP
jgi:hypothetical protein